MSEDFSIQFVARVTGINPHTLRAWEKRYEAVKPHRDDNGRRLYSEGDIERLRTLNDLVDMGNKISDIAQLPTDKLKNMHDQFIGPANANGLLNSNGHVNGSGYSNINGLNGNGHSIHEPIDVHTSLQNLTLALRGYKLDIITHELEKINNSMSLRDFALGIITPLLLEVGAQVETRQLTIAQEHALSAILRFHIGRTLFQHYSYSPKNNINILLTTPSGENHEFGILISALLCCHYHVNFQYMGVDLPLQSLSDAVNQIKPTYVIVGISKNYNHQAKIPLTDYAEKLLADIPQDVDVWFGGAVSELKNFDYKNMKLVSSFQTLDSMLSKL
jgi:methanogenic corrinoid protein MtbC1